MLSSSLTNAAAYASLSPFFAAAFRFCQTTDLLSLPLRRHDILGDDVFALVQENTLKPVSACRWEAHRTYADIQLILSGTEALGVAPLEHFTVETPHDDNTDVAFFRPSHPHYPTQILTLPPNHFAIFLPHDAHMPLIAPPNYNGKPVRKVVFKVRVP